MSDIVERLQAIVADRDAFSRAGTPIRINDTVTGWLREAAGEITQLRGEISYLKDEVIPALKAEAEDNERLRVALKPFAAAEIDLSETASDQDHLWESPAAMSLNAGHLREARRVYEQRAANEAPKG